MSAFTILYRFETIGDIDGGVVMEHGSFHCDGSILDQQTVFEKIYYYSFADNATFMAGWKKVKNVIPEDKRVESLIKAQTFFFSREVCKVDYHKYKIWLTENGKDMQCFDHFFNDEPLPPTETPKVDTNLDYSKPSSSLSEPSGQVLNTTESLSTKFEKSCSVNTNCENSSPDTKCSSVETHDSVATTQQSASPDTKCSGIETHASVITTQQNADTDTDSTNKETIKHPANFMELIEMIQAGVKLPDTDDLNIEPLNEDPTPAGLQIPKKPWEVS